MNINRNERGALNVLLVPVILLALLFIGSSVFAYWAFAGRQDYKTNSDKKVATAVAANTIVVKQADAKAFAEANKQPFRTYVGPTAYGSVHVSYPKTWSAYVSSYTGGSNPLEGYFYPDVVPSISDQNSAFALRVQVLPQAYDVVVANFNGYVQQKKLTIVPYTLPQVPDIIGVRLDGQIGASRQGSMVILPMRDKTLKIWTEVPEFQADFNNSILPNVTFIP